MIELREYRIGDEKYILELYIQVFNRELTIDAWEWKYNSLYPDKKLIFLAFKDSHCIGHYALMPYSINAFGEVVQSFISLDSMVHPDFRGQKIFSKLMKYAQSKINNSGEPYLTFLNEKSISIYTKRYGWKYLGHIPVYCRPLSLKYIKNNNKILFSIIKPFALLINYIFNKDNNIILKEFNLFDETIESILMEDRFYSLDRSEEFLKWRFDKSPNKYMKYKIFYKHKLIGYCVLRKEIKFGINIMWIMDLVINRDYEIFYSHVLNSISIKFLYISDFITSLIPMHRYSKYFIKSGFIKIPTFSLPHKFYFCLNKNNYNDDRINKLENWYMTWALNDVL